MTNKSQLIEDDSPESLWSEITADALENGPDAPDTACADTNDYTPIEAYKLWRDKETLEYLYWDNRLSQREIADRLGCSTNTVFRWHGQHGIESRYQGINSSRVHKSVKQLRGADKRELYEMMWGEGLTSSEIAERFDTSSSAVLRHFGRLNIPVIDNGSRNAWVFRMLSRERLYEIYWGEGMTHSQIANRYNVGQQLISKVFNERDIPQEPHRPSDFDGTTIPQMYEWPDDRNDGGTHPQHKSLPENPDGSKYLADTQTMNKEKLYELHWKYGCSIAHIAEIIDSSEHTVRNRMNEYGIPTRSWGTHTKWEPHHNSVPPKYEWPDGKPPSEIDDENDKQQGIWRVPASGD